MTSPRIVPLFLSLLTLIVWPFASAMAFEIEDRRLFGPANVAEAQRLRIVSTGDIAVFAPVVEAFLVANPSVAVDYVAVSSTQLVAALREGEAFDVALSSAMDLQMKIANDGGARIWRSDATARLPRHAVWGDRLFAFTREPATIVLSPSAFAGLELPRTRQALIETLRAHPERFRGKVGTYDVRDSGLGFLFATQDARASDTYWRLMEVLGTLDVRLYCCSGAMIEDVAAGRLALAYNVLGGYVGERTAGIAVIEPRDFTTVMMRTALIPTASRRPALAGRFIDHLVSGEMTSPGVDAGEQAARRLIRLGPGLLVYLDRLKRALFLEEWRSAVVQ